MLICDNSKDKVPESSAQESRGFRDFIFTIESPVCPSIKEKSSSVVIQKENMKKEKKKSKGEKKKK